MVKFVKSFRQYHKDDVAKFSHQHEAWLIDQNIAEKFTPPAKVKKEEQGGNKGQQQGQQGQGAGGGR